MPHVKRNLVAQAHRRARHTGYVPKRQPAVQPLPNPLIHLPRRAYEARDARIAGPHHGRPVLDRPENGHGKVLVQLAGEPVPPLVRDVDQELRALTREPTNQRRHHVFIADKRTETGRIFSFPCRRKLEDHRFVSGREGALEGGQSLDKRQPVHPGHVLPERH